MTRAPLSHCCQMSVPTRFRVGAALVCALLMSGLSVTSAAAPAPEMSWTATASAHVHWKKFTMPSRNIACLYDSGKLRCDIFSGLTPEPDKPCAFFWKGMMLPATGRASYLCIIDTIFDEDARTLRYGSRWSRDGLACRSRSTGLRCHNQDGHGFLLSRSLSKKW